MFFSGWNFDLLAIFWWFVWSSYWLYLSFLFFLFLKFLEDMSPFCGATDTPFLDFWWRLPWVSKPGWIPRLRASFIFFVTDLFRWRIHFLLGFKGACEICQFKRRPHYQSNYLMWGSGWLTACVWERAIRHRMILFIWMHAK